MTQRDPECVRALIREGRDTFAIVSIITTAIELETAE